MKADISIITAMTRQQGLGPGGNGRALWFMPEDLDRFQEITTPHPIVMTDEIFKMAVSVIGEPFPGRTSIVIDPSEPLPDRCLSARNVEDGLHQGFELDSEEVFLMGNGQFYHRVLPYVTKLYITIVEGEYETPESFPPYGDFTLTHSEHGTSGGYSYEFQILQRALKGDNIEL